MQQNTQRKSKENKFEPKLRNYTVSLSYEGLVLKKEDTSKTIAELKRKYAR